MNQTSESCILYTTIRRSQPLFLSHVRRREKMGTTVKTGKVEETEVEEPVEDGEN